MVAWARLALALYLTEAFAADRDTLPLPQYPLIPGPSAGGVDSIPDGSLLQFVGVYSKSGGASATDTYTEARSHLPSWNYALPKLA